MSTEHEKYKVRKDLMSTMALETDVGKVTSSFVTPYTLYIYVLII